MVLDLGSSPYLTEFCPLALWESQLAQLGLAAASCVARCEQLPECTAQGNQLLKLALNLFASKSPRKGGRFMVLNELLAWGS